MTEVRNGVLFIEPEKPQQCDMCGEIKELRPYGPNGSCVCYECGMKNPEEMLRNLRRRLSGELPFDVRTSHDALSP